MREGPWLLGEVPERDGVVWGLLVQCVPRVLRRECRKRLHRPGRRRRTTATCRSLDKGEEEEERREFVATATSVVVPCAVLVPPLPPPQKVVVDATTTDEKHMRGVVSAYASSNCSPRTLPKFSLNHMLAACRPTTSSPGLPFNPDEALNSYPPEPAPHLAPLRLAALLGEPGSPGSCRYLVMELERGDQLIKRKRGDRRGTRLQPVLVTEAACRFDDLPVREVKYLWGCSKLDIGSYCIR